MRNQHKRYRYRSGTVDACSLPADKGLPKKSATGDDLAKYQARNTETLTGGFDPCSLIRKST